MEIIPSELLQFRNKFIHEWKVCGYSVAFEVTDEFGKRLEIRPLHKRAKIVDIWKRSIERCITAKMETLK